MHADRSNEFSNSDQQNSLIVLQFYIQIKIVQFWAWSINLAKYWKVGLFKPTFFLEPLVQEWVFMLSPS